MNWIRTDDLLARYNAGERNFAGIFLEGSEMAGVDLSGIDLSDSDLGEIYMEDVNFTGANFCSSRIGQAGLIRCILRDADLTRTNMGFAHLSRSDLTNAKLVDAYLSGADMVETNLTESDLTRADLEGANMKRSIYYNTIMPDGSIRTTNKYLNKENKSLVQPIKTPSEEGLGSGITIPRRLVCSRCGAIGTKPNINDI
ncbi:pentapeptide repeat-containing protein [Dolichospermum sp. UHCC 0259]|uniref:pentapeptide repeat-containing protein n=1 Tax=Dolichospermum sp. UHCC 0259 TaxID=2590010 RepID=UPI001447AF89|nr:pentapeptide repeat-containing protein [Dolichospermum sp. UHCC 0259]MTJ49969.1 pentapeptide repeat-containing protein [Dolichospermum sp. UHCC 0259]